MVPLEGALSHQQALPCSVLGWAPSIHFSWTRWPLYLMLNSFPTRVKIPAQGEMEGKQGLPGSPACWS